jgi:protein TonB
MMMGGSARSVPFRSVSTVPEPRPLAARLVLPEAVTPGAPAVAERQRSSSAAAAKPKAAAIVAVPRPGPDSHAAGSAPVDAADSTYYGARQLDVYPALVSVLDLSHSTDKNDGAQGYVLLLVMIDAAGAVDEVSVVEAQGSGIAKDDALAALRSARFTPAVRGGRMVKSRLFIRIDYGAAAETR